MAQRTRARFVLVEVRGRWWERERPERIAQEFDAHLVAT